MVEFCPKCGNVLIPAKRGEKYWLFCKKCNRYYKPKKGIEFSEKIKEKKKEVVVMKKEEDLKEFPETTITCPVCGHEKAYWWMQQTRGADEPPTLFYRCKKCGYTWRSYS